MRKIIGGIILAVCLLLAIGFFGFGPKYTEESRNKVELITAPAEKMESLGLKDTGVEQSRNKVTQKGLLEISNKARQLHQSLQIVDLHSDTLLWSRNVIERADRGHMDLPRLQDGNVAIQIFSSVTKSPKGQNYDGNSGDTDNITPLVIAQMQPMRTWSSLLERSLFHAQKLSEAEITSKGQLSFATRSKDIDAILKQRGEQKNLVGAVLSVEGLHNLEGKRENLLKLYNVGVRMAGLTHFFDNEVAGSMHGVKKGGLTKLGRQIIGDMEEMGMIVDIAHCSRKCVAEVLAMARRPVVSSHGGVKATCDNNRNLTDAEIKGVAATGGIIGIGYWPAAVCGTNPHAIARAIKHIRDLVGIEHVALGSDYDGSVTVSFDTSQLVQVTQALLDTGFSDSEIRAIMGGNALRILKQGMLPFSQLPKPKENAKEAG